jgi:hypothetical protein
MRYALRALAIAGCCLLLAGCGKSTSATAPVAPPVPTDSELVTTAALALSDYLRDDVYDVTASTAARARQAGPLTAMEPLSFFRWYSSAGRDIAVTLSDPDSTGRPRSADLLVRRDLRGMLHVTQQPAAGSEPDTHNVIHKFVHDLWQRHLIMKRVADPAADNGSTIWAPVNVAIQSVQLQVQGDPTYDRTISDPAAPIADANLPRVVNGQSEQVTVTTGQAGQVVLLYTPNGRVRMTDQLNGTYTASFTPSASSAHLHLAVNVLSHATLYDDTLPYDSAAWVIPYKVTIVPA